MIRFLQALKKAEGDSLTAIYFFERGNTQRLHVPKNRVVIISFAVLLGLTWLVASTGFVISMWHDNQLLSQQIAKSQQGIFYYQSRYEDIFEKTYKKKASPTISQQQQPKEQPVTATH